MSQFGNWLYQAAAPARRSAYDRRQRGRQGDSRMMLEKGGVKLCQERIAVEMRPPQDSNVGSSAMTDEDITTSRWLLSGRLTTPPAWRS
jgi:hypothetical protein